MPKVRLENQSPPEPLDADTRAAVELGLAAIQRGEIVTLEESDANLRKRLETWRKARKENLAA